jgi:hypothetical protein
VTLATRPPVNPCARQRGHAEPGAMSDDFWRAVLDPSAPLPHAWPVGALGVFLLFCVPIGGGIPAGVLMARNAGVPPPAIAVLYFFSDIVLAFTFEPILRIVTWLGRWLPPLARVGSWIRSLAHSAGGAQTGARGPLGLILVAFGVDPMTGRAAAAAAGHGFLPGWAIAITGDMLYFVVLMASTLWLQGVLGDERLTIGAVLFVMLVLPSLVRHFTVRAAT